jgi:nucleoside-diphosphate-sugar epimerase
MGPIAIIGAGGFVGTRLIESLVLDQAAEVRAVVRAYRNFASLSRFGPAITLTLANAESAAALVPVLQDCATVINLTSGTPASIVRTTQAIVQACLEAKVKRLIHLSSAVVYGEVVGSSTSDDSPPLRGHWMPYARAKAAAEIWIRRQMPRCPCQIAVLRPGIVWGVRSPHTMNVIKAMLDKSAYLVDEGKGICNAIYIDNLIACIRTCCAHPADIAGFYNISDREVITWRDFYGAFATSLGCDLQRIPHVSGNRFPWSAPALVDYVQNLPFVSDLYHRLKSRVPDTLKSRIKALLAGHYNYEPAAQHYVTKPVVERELWSLQRVKHKLPVTKFARHFAFTPPVSFEEGVRRTLSWLAFVGYTPRRPAMLNQGACL